MATGKQREKGKEPLTPARIVSAAVWLADKHGIDQLTMRRLATHLDTGPMSLYNHVADKDDLIDDMIDLIAAEIDLPGPGSPWKTAIHDLAIATHHTLQQHPWAIAPWASRTPGPNRYALMEALLDNLASAELPADIADLGFHAIINHLQSSAQRQETSNTSPDDCERFYDDIDRHQFPRVVEHVQFQKEARPTRDEFTFVLDLILDGLEHAAHAA